MITIRVNKQAAVAGALLATLLMLLVLLVFVRSDADTVINVSDMPWNYTESEKDYEKYTGELATEVFESLNEFSTVNVETFDSTDTYESVDVNVTDECRDIILMSDSEAWNLISGGLFPEYPTGSYASYEALIKKIYNEKMVMVTVPVWKWENNKDKTDLSKSSYNLRLAVNEELADMFVEVFRTIYNDPTKPVINIDDAGMGTWVLRGKNHNNNSTISGHALGTTIDINPSTGSFKVNGKWYGNGYGQTAMPKYVWEALPECQEKYNVLYQDCPIVQVFKSYGFIWGGDWKNGTDCMHFSFLGDGKNAREKGKANYLMYN